MILIRAISDFLYGILIHRVDIDMEERLRRIIYIILVLIAFPLIAYFGYKKLLSREYLFGITDLLLAALLVGTIPLLRRLKQGRHLFRLAVFCLSSAAVYWLYTGVNDGSSSLWYLAIPSVAFFLFGKREGLVWSITLISISIAVFLYLNCTGTSRFYTLPFMVRHVILQFLIILLTYNYESVRNLYKAHMEDRQQKLILERNVLDEVNTQLKAEIGERERVEKELQAHREHLEEVVARRTDELRMSLREKDVLLKELYHRTKNNMQVISGMISLSASRPGNEGFADIFRDLEMKIRAMSLVHQKLYESMDLTHINAREYISSLASNLLDVLSVSEKAISLRFNIDDISLSIDTAIPFGLVLNELLSNSIKHAFKGRNDNIIEMDMKASGDGFTLLYRDNGIGLPADFNRDASSGMGMLILRKLIELQLKGSLRILESPGFSCEMRVTTGLYSKRV